MSFVASLCGIFGFLIWKKEKVDLIHNYHLKEIEDLKGYTSTIGRNLLILALLLFLNGAVGLFPIFSLDLIKVALYIGILLAFLRFFRIQKKYSKKRN